MRAAEGGYASILTKLLDQRAHIDHQDTKCWRADDFSSLREIYVGGRTALMIACREGHVEGARVLLERKAGIEMADSSGETALYKAALKKQTFFTLWTFRGLFSPVWKSPIVRVGPNFIFFRGDLVESLEFC